jgi:hypothetical protein
MQTMLSQESADRSGQKSSKMSPCDHLEGEVSRAIVPIVVDEIRRGSNKSIPIAFGSPDVVYQAELTLVHLFEVKV